VLVRRNCEPHSRRACNRKRGTDQHYNSESEDERIADTSCYNSSQFGIKRRGWLQTGEFDLVCMYFIEKVSW
jgi:hypothetical protein